MMAMLLSITIAGAYLGSVVVARHRAQATADLAALAAAAHLTAGTGAACAEASAVARTMGAAAAHCAVDDLDVVVTVDVAVAFDRWGAGPARAAARAGPVDVG
jgi:secretion/DNA translocation related TadE-like protein